MLRFNCPGCKTAYRVSDDRAGRKAECPECKRVLTVPTIGMKRLRVSTGAGTQTHQKQRTQNVRRSSSKERDLIIGCLVLGFLVAAVVYAAISEPDRPGVSDSGESRSREAYAGQTGRLATGEPDGVVIVAVSKTALARLKTLADADDREGTYAMLLAGTIYTVPCGTSCRVIQTTWGGTCEVRILDGEHYGRSGWVQTKFFR